MKAHPHRRPSAFTIVELVAVIAIASVLFVLICWPRLGSRPSAPRQTAAVVVRNVVIAAKNFKEDYGHYPEIPAAQDGTPANPYLSFGDQAEGRCKVSNAQLLDVLRAIDRGPNAGHVLNPKQTKYYENKKATDPRNPRDGFADGPEFNASRQGQLLDPWGAQYCFLLETDQDELLDLAPFFTDLTGPHSAVHFGAVGFSLGKDNRIGGPGYPGRYRKDHSTEAPDDVVSWP